MINFLKTSKKIFIESIISFLIFIPALMCGRSCPDDASGFGCIHCLLYLFIPSIAWMVCLLVIIMNDFIKKRDGKILEIILLGANFLIFSSSFLVSYDPVGPICFYLGVGLLILNFLSPIYNQVKSSVEENKIQGRISLLDRILIVFFIISATTLLFSYFFPAKILLSTAGIVLVIAVVYMFWYYNKLKVGKK